MGDYIYKNTMTGWGLRVLLACMTGYVAVRAWNEYLGGGDAAWPLFAATCILALAMMLFTSLTVEITAEDLRVSMGGGFIGTTLPLARIESTESTAIPWYSVGLKRIRRGWMYSVSVSDALVVTMDDQRRYVIGTDDAYAFGQALESARGKAGSVN